MSNIEGFTAELFEALHAGNGIETLVRAAYTRLGNPISVCDTSFSILCRFPVGEDTDDIVEENGRVFIRDNAIDMMRAEKLVSRLYESPEPFFVYRDGFDYQWMYCGIRIKHAVVGYVLVRAKRHPFEDTDAEYVAVLAKMLSVEMQKSEFFARNTGLRYEYFLNDLLEGRFVSAEAAGERMEKLGRSPGAFYTLLIFDYDTEQRSGITSGYFVEQIHAIFPKGLAVVYKENPLLLLSGSEDKPFSDHQVKKLNDFLMLNFMRCVVSYSFDSLLDVPSYYTAALAARELISEARLVYYGDIAVRHLLSSAKGELSLRHWIHPKVKRITDYDLLHSTDFGKTLRCYLASGRNAAKTGELLQLHKSTISYRFKKLSELFGVSVDDDRLMLAFELSFQIIDEPSFDKV